MTVDNENTQSIVRKVKCPHCHHAAKYRIAVKGVHIALKSLFNSCVMSLVFLLLGITLSVTGGWKVLGLAIVGVIVVTLVDYLFTIVSFRFLRVILPRLIPRPKSFLSTDEMTTRQFTVILKCTNRECSNPDKSFEAKLWLPIEYGSANSFSVDRIEIVG